MVFGGASFISLLLKNHLVDEINFFINTVTIGKGLEIFGDKTSLKLVQAKAFECVEVF